ncbi:MAG: preprotein translocase subunit SecA [Opitutia bacterium Tous-C2FEB]|jgi:preprotein translocase subunit SecA|nr:MAG: preprotein translocase subunit SecA [Opitutae bacterium Tous-C2FEB]
MFLSILKLFAGSHNRSFLRKCAPVVKKINALELTYQNLSEHDLRAKTAEFKARVAKGESLDTLLPEAFAVVKNAARRLCGTKALVCDHEQTWQMVHFDVQLIGGIALHQKKIAEMATGEGKTLVATLPLYLNALTGRNCQLVTVNDYLARRDSEWMGHLLSYLGLTVGCIQNQMGSEERQKAYACDITYGTASEFGFDYLRDNGMALSAGEQVQREHYFCIVDEIDSILIDEARTPLIISGPVTEEREPPFMRLVPQVKVLVDLQTRLATRLINEAEAELRDLPDNKEPSNDTLDKLWLTANGMPRNKSFARLMENGRWRKLLEKHEGILASQAEKDRRYHLKERLYFAISERNHESDLTQLGRDTLRPGEPDAFVLPDLPTYFVELDNDASLTPEKRSEFRAAAEAAYIKVSEDIHAIGQLLKAFALYEKDRHYVVHEGKVMIVDENTGRIMSGRRWSDGLHQAVEAKEGVTLEKENKTYATITIQNYFRMYEKLAGMTGTAETEATEFNEIYNLTVVTIPTNQPCIRTDANDIVFKTRREKYQFVIKELTEAHKRGQPVLVGTASVEASETLSRMLTLARIPHKVLNAKHHEQEADIVAMAGQNGAVTIATNMAGRGTDIRLGDGVRELGGLYVLGTERHESRRVDRQLRGRCSRQGDPGHSRFLVALEDDLMRLFSNAGIISSLLEKSFKEGEPLEHPLLDRSIGTAQKRVEGQNYSMRKRLLQFDDVLNHQRQIVYGLRNRTLHEADTRANLLSVVGEEIEERLKTAYPDLDAAPDRAGAEAFVAWFVSTFPIRLAVDELTPLNHDLATACVIKKVAELQKSRETSESPEMLNYLERHLLLRSIDRNWQNHLTEMEELRRAVNLRGYAQKDPLNEYKTEAYRAFVDLMRQLRTDVCSSLFRTASSMEALEAILRTAQGQVIATGPAEPGTPEDQPAAASAPETMQQKQEPFRRNEAKIGRNAVVRIRKGNETLDLKWKKAEAMVRDEGWVVIETLSE